jgi:uncharacterized protein with PQ loop repeat
LCACSATRIVAVTISSALSHFLLYKRLFVRQKESKRASYLPFRLAADRVSIISSVILLTAVFFSITFLLQQHKHGNEDKDSEMHSN